MPHNLLKISVLYLTAILLTIVNLNSISNNPTGLVISLPLFEIMIIYYFAIYKKNVFGLGFIFFIGIWSDSLNGIPLGITSLIYVVVVKIFDLISHKQSPKEDFKSILKEFVIFITVILFLKWLLLSFYYKDPYSVSPFLSQVIISSLTYVIMHKFFDFLSKKFLIEY